MKRLRRISMVPGINLVPDKKDMELVSNFNHELSDETKWVRFRMFGDNQGCLGRYGYWKEKLNNNNIKMHFYLVELYSFESTKSKHNMLSYKNVLIIHEIDENKNVLNSYCMDGGCNYPMTAKNSLLEKLNGKNGEEIIFDDTLF